MRMTRRGRRGTTLIELLVSLPLALLVVGLANAMLLATGRLARQLGRALSAHQQLESARATLSADLRRLRTEDLVHLSDTLLLWTVPRWIGVVCAVEPSASGGAFLLIASLPEAPRGPLPHAGGGELELWRRDPSMPAATPVPVRLPIRYPPVELPPASCPPVGPAPTTRWRLHWQAETADQQSAEVGLPVVILDVVRFVHYRSGARWWLGRARRLTTGWDLPQPVAGPLASPTAGGMRVLGLTSQGVVSTELGRVTAVRIHLRGATADGAASDSAGFVLPLASLGSRRD